MRAGCAVRAAFAAGSLLTSLAWAKRRTGVRLTAMAAVTTAIGCRRKDRKRTLENGAPCMVDANTPDRKAR
jgi:hypothetical protein